MTVKTYIYNLVRQPRRNLYRSIVDYAASQCDTALLVVYQNICLAPTASKVLSELEPYLKERSMLSEWPGTRCWDSQEEVFKYTLTNTCAEILKRSSNGLYRWRQPALPEDLCFLRADGQPWLVSITHEKDAYFCLTQQEKLELVQAIPKLSWLIRQQRE
jgi:hypothetical protein